MCRVSAPCMLKPRGLSRSFKLNMSPECHAKRTKLAKTGTTKTSSSGGYFQFVFCCIHSVNCASVNNWLRQWYVQNLAPDEPPVTSSAWHGTSVHFEQSRHLHFTCSHPPSSSILKSQIPKLRILGEVPSQLWHILAPTTWLSAAMSSPSTITI